MIAIIDYGLGNVSSVANMLKKVTQDKVVISGDHEVIEKATKLVLPGVGHFDQGMNNLGDRKLVPLLTRLIQEEGKPILGICLGMQLMCLRSEEGSAPGLGWINAEFKRFPAGSERKIPHMGWNWVRFVKDSQLTRYALPNSRFYFVHSYYCARNAPEDTLATCAYGPDFTAAFEHKNIYGVQFHPEKSHQFGLAIMRGFASFGE